MDYQDLKCISINGVVINYTLLSKVLNAKKEKLNNSIMDDNTKYIKKKLAIIRTVYPD
jgi:hypothetical protein